MQITDPYPVKINNKYDEKYAVQMQVLFNVMFGSKTTLSQGQDPASRDDRARGVVAQCRAPFPPKNSCATPPCYSQPL